MGRVRAWLHPGVVIENRRIIPHQVVPLLYQCGSHGVIETYEGMFPVYWVVLLKNGQPPSLGEIIEGHAGIVGRKRIFAAAVAACQRLERESYGKG